MHETMQDTKQKLHTRFPAVFLDFNAGLNDRPPACWDAFITVFHFIRLVRFCLLYLVHFSRPHYILNKFIVINLFSMLLVNPNADAPFLYYTNDNDNSRSSTGVALEERCLVLMFVRFNHLFDNPMYLVWFWLTKGSG